MKRIYNTHMQHTWLVQLTGNRKVLIILGCQGGLNAASQVARTLYTDNEIKEFTPYGEHNVFGRDGKLYKGVLLP